MAAVALTHAKIEKAVQAGVPASKAHVVLWDVAVTGLGLKLRPSGTCSWVLIYRPRGSGRSQPSRTITLGSWPSLTLDAARTAAKSHVGAIALGRDPAAEAREARTREKRVLSVCFDEYEASLRRRGIVNVKTTMSTLRRHLAALAARDIGTITRSDVVAVVDGLEEAGLPGAASDTRKHTSALFEWAVARGYVPFNPLAGLRRPRSSRAARLADGGRRVGRALDDDEIAQVWAACGSRGAFGGLVRLGVLTGLRRGELAGLSWSDILDDRIVVEAERAKAGVRHEVPLTPAMRAVLQAQRQDDGEAAADGLVFRSSRRVDAVQLSGWSKMVAALESASGVSFTLHDARRTLRTGLSRLGVAEDVAELCIGHARKGLVATYDKSDRWPERVAAFTAWSNHVAQVLTAAGVTAAAGTGAAGEVVPLLAAGGSAGGAATGRRC